MRGTDSEQRPRIGEQLRTIGRAALDLFRAKAPEAITLTPELIIPDAKPARPSPAHAAEYPRDPFIAGEEIPDTPEGPAWALAYAQAAFPKSQLSALSAKGSSGVILEDTYGHAYKVYFHARGYEYVEQEAAYIQYLGDLGIAPRLHLLVDTDPRVRAEDSKVWRPNVKDDIIIPRQETRLPLPIIVMDKIDAAEPTELSVARALEEFDRLSRIVLEHYISLGDTELVLNRQTDRLMFIDIGGVTVYKDQESAPVLWPVSPNDSAEAINASREANLIRELAFRFLPYCLPEIDQAARAGGAPAVRAVIEGYWNKPNQGQE